MLALAVSDRSALALIPGLLLQGLGLGIVLTVNDPTGLTAVPEKDSGEAAGMINTSEQLGGAFGIAILAAVELAVNFHILDEKLASRGIHPTPEQTERFREFILHAEQSGLKNLPEPHLIKTAIGDVVAAHVEAFQVMFSVSAGIALLGALFSLLLVRKTDRLKTGPVFGRRSRWIYATQGRSSAVTRRPAPE